MLEVLAILLIIILSPVVLIAGFISFILILGITYSILSIPLNLVKQVIKWLKQEDQQNITKNTVKK